MRKEQVEFIDPEKEGYRLIARGGDLWLTPPFYGDVDRFVSVFHDTWNRIPETVRHELMHYWREHPKWTCNPQIRLFNDWRDAHNELGPWFGICLDEGHTLQFFAFAVDRMEEEELAALIAHELAHAWHCATGYRKPREEISRDDAAMAATGWGFNVEAVSRWHKNHPEE